MRLTAENPPPAPTDITPNGAGSTAFWQFTVGFLFVGAIIVAANMGWLTSISQSVHSLPLGDKLVHAVAMGGLCALADRAFPSRPLWRPIGWLRRTPVLVTLLVIGEEFSQLWIPGRNFDVGDLVADLLGIGIALGCRQRQSDAR
jgi:hypothetical protein